MKCVYPALITIKILYKSMHIVILTTTNYAIDMFMINSLKKLSNEHKVTILTNCRDDKYYNHINADTIYIPIRRKPSIIIDFFTLLKTMYYLKKIKPDIVHSMTPKGGLIASISAYIVGVKYRFHTFTGQVWANKYDIKSKFLMKLDALICNLSVQTFSDSKSQSNFLNTMLNPKKLVKTIGNGSLGGVNMTKYNTSLSKKQLLKQKKFLADKNIITYLARKTYDKGAYDCLKIFDELVKIRNDVILLFLGPEEDIFNKDFNFLLKKHKNNIININEMVDDYEFYSITDLLVLPSYREGFGLSIIKSAAMGIRTIAYDIYGVKDSVTANNGATVPLGDIKLFANQVNLELNRSEAEKEKYFSIAREFAYKFSSEIFDEAWLNIHRKDK